MYVFRFPEVTSPAKKKYESSREKVMTSSAGRYKEMKSRKFLF